MKKVLPVFILLISLAIGGQSVYALINNPCEADEGGRGGGEEVIIGTNGSILILQTGNSSVCTPSGNGSGGGAGAGSGAARDSLEPYLKYENILTWHKYGVTLRNITQKFSWRRLDSDLGATSYRAIVNSIVKKGTTTETKAVTVDSSMNGNNVNSIASSDFLRFDEGNGYCRYERLDLSSYNSKKELIRRRVIQNCPSVKVADDADPRTGQNFAPLKGQFYDNTKSTFETGDGEKTESVNVAISRSEFAKSKQMIVSVLDKNFNKVSSKTYGVAVGDNNYRVYFENPKTAGVYYLSLSGSHINDGTIDQRRIDVTQAIPQTFIGLKASVDKGTNNKYNFNVKFNRNGDYNYKATYTVTDIYGATKLDKVLKSPSDVFSVQINNPGQTREFCTEYDVTISAHDPRNKNAQVSAESVKKCFDVMGREIGKHPSGYIKPALDDMPVKMPLCKPSITINGNSSYVEVERNSIVKVEWKDAGNRGYANFGNTDLGLGQDSSGSVNRQAPMVPGTYPVLIECLDQNGRYIKGNTVTLVVKNPSYVPDVVVPQCSISVAGPGSSYEGDPLSFSWTSQNIDSPIELRDNGILVGKYSSNSSYVEESAISSNRVFELSGTNKEGKTCSASYNHTVNLPPYSALLQKLKTLQASVRTAPMAPKVFDSIKASFNSLFK